MAFDMMSLMQNPMFMMGANLLAQSGPSLQPTSLGQSLGRAGLATGQGLMQAQQFAQQQALQKAQMDALAQAEAQRQAQEDARNKLAGFLDLPPEVSSGLFAAYPDMMGKVLASQLIPQQQKPMDPFTLSPGQTRYTPEGSVIASLPLAPEAPAKDESFERSDKLRDEFTKGAGEFIKVRDAYGRIVASAQNPSAAGDLALIFNYMKVLDPGSTIREGEFATAQNSAGVPAQVRNLFNQVMTGERLAPEQRDDFVNRAGKLYESQEKGLSKLEGIYTRLAESFNLNPQQITPDYRVDYGLVGPLGNQTGGAMVPPLPPGAVPGRRQ